MKTRNSYLRRLVLVTCFSAAITMPALAQTDADSTVTSTEEISRTLDSLKQSVTTLQAQQAEAEHEAYLERVWKRRRYVNFCYITSQTLTNKDIDGVEWKSKFGVALARGTTYYMHRKPIVGMIKIGLDWTQLDLTYVKYEDPSESDGSSTSSTQRFRPLYFDSYESTDYDLGIDLGMQQIEYAMHIGPSVTVNPVDYLKVAAYFHYVPTGTVALLDSKASFAFANNFAFGMTVAYKVISLGFETRWGSGKYNSFDSEELDVDIENSSNPISALFTEKTKMKTKSFRLMLALRF